MKEEKNLYQRIAEVMKDVSYLQKDDNIEYKTTKYKAISEEKVTTTVRASLLKHGLVIIPIEQEHKRDDTVGDRSISRLTTVNTKYKIINIDKPAEFEFLSSSGTGIDTQDKGVGKAMTYSYKYLLLRTFAIPTGEDPDNISSAELDDKIKADLASNKQVQLIESLIKNASITEAQRTQIEEDIFSMTSERAKKCIAFLQENQVDKPLNKQLDEKLNNDRS